MKFLIAHELRRLGKRHDDNCNAAPVEFRFERLHLSEVSLAGQSGKLPEKD